MYTFCSISYQVVSLVMQIRAQKRWDPCQGLFGFENESILIHS